MKCKLDLHKVLFRKKKHETAGTDESFKNKVQGSLKVESTSGNELK